MRVEVALGPWWAFVLRGLSALLFGVLALLMPGMALLTLVMLFGAYALVEGVFNVAAAVRRGEPRRQPAWVLLLEGGVSILAGLLALALPGLTALSLLFLIAAWSLLTGVLEIGAAVRLRRQLKGEWLLALSGVLSVAFGVLLMAFPGAGALAVILWIAAYAVVFGAMLVALGAKLRSWSRSDRPHAGLGELATSPGR
jgi:uncharacterized membrane protein HdeD (DUF308 family)